MNLSRCFPREFNSWANMKQRCNNPKHPRYNDWGGRGITVCQEWSAFSGFLKDMGKCPEGKTLNRLDNDSGYSPDNCEWSTKSDQSLNQRIRKDNSLKERGISFTGHSYRVNLHRWGVKHTSLSLKTLEEAIELRDFALEVMNDS